MSEHSEPDIRLPVRGMLIGYIVIPALLLLALAMLFFSPFGSLPGLLEELVPFVLIFVPLAAAMGWGPF